VKHPAAESRLPRDELALGDLRIVRRLSAKPVSVRQSEEPAQPKVGVRRDRPPL